MNKLARAEYEKVGAEFPGDFRLATFTRDMKTLTVPESLLVHAVFFAESSNCRSFTDVIAVCVIAYLQLWHDERHF